MTERWMKAQKAEQLHHEEAIKHFSKSYAQYFDTYRQYFSHLARSFNLYGRSIIEIGAGPFPALVYCLNYGNSTIMDPIKYRTYPILMAGKPGLNHQQSLTGRGYDEAWLFNCLQHVDDPREILEWCVNKCQIVRFFEPINLPTDEMHLHTLTLDLFKEYFGSSVRIYPENLKANNFHSAECVYGLYISEQ